MFDFSLVSKSFIHRQIQKLKIFRLGESKNFEKQRNESLGGVTGAELVARPRVPWAATATATGDTAGPAAGATTSGTAGGAIGGTAPTGWQTTPTVILSEHWNRVSR